MDAEREQQVMELLEAALQQSGTAPTAWLQQACGNDTELFREAADALDWEQRMGGFMRNPVIQLNDQNTTAGADGESDQTSAEEPGAQIGPYTLIRPLGEGGMGTVFLAEQHQPIRRQVALKIVKAGLDSQTVIARFEAERQALAKMDHPNIAKVLDAGTTSTGRPYFVMELVSGAPITTYANDHRLSIPERLQLMIQVCQGIQHAHQKSIIHRDIKPSNIIVTEHDGQPVPKIIDFGIAKALEPSFDDAPTLTVIGMVIGTLEYMSPEQAGAASGDIDTRSDIYSLGVLLYELLTGTTPLQIDSKLAPFFPEVLRRIREEDPVLPSARLTASRETLATVCEQRQANPAKLPKLVRGELDWVVMKALEKDRAQRFETANGLARELQRYLNGEPLEVGPPSATYRALKFAKRYRRPLAAAAAFAILLAAGVVVSAWEAVRARQAERTAEVQRDRAVTAEEQARREKQAATRDRDLALAAEARAQQQRGIALTEKQRADTETASAKAVNEFLQNDLLAQATASQQFRQKMTPDPDLKVRTALDRAAAQIEGKFTGQPKVEASIRNTIAQTYSGLGNMKEAVQQLRRVLELRRKTLGEQHPDTLETLQDLGHALSEDGNYPEAERYIVQAIRMRSAAVGDHHPATLNAKEILANLRVRQSKYSDARALLTEIFEARRKQLGESHPETLAAESQLALVIRFDGDLREARALQLKVFEARRKQLGEDHPDTLTVASDLSETNAALGNYAEAEKLILHVAGAQLRVLGADHPNRLSTLNNLANLQFRQGKYPEATALNRQVLEGQKRILGNEHPDTLNTMINLAICYRAAGKYDDAEAIYLKVIEVQKRVLGEEHSFTQTAINNLGVVYSAHHKDKQAEEMYARVLAFRTKKLGPDHPDTLNSTSNVALSMGAQGRFAEAEVLFEKVLAGYRRNSLPEHPLAVLVMQNLGTVYTKQGKYQQAEAMFRDCLALREKLAPEAWSRYQVADELGNLLLLQSRFAEAEPYLLSGYSGMLERYQKMPANERSKVELAGTRLVELYEKWGKPEKLAEWRGRIEKDKQAVAQVH